ncbi:MAG: WD40 repeat domain-containing protein, partial [Planctomycetota bacterium]
AEDMHPQIRDAATGKVHAVLKGHLAKVNCVDWHPTRPLIATGADDNAVRFWDAETGTCLQMISVRGDVTLLAWEPSGRRLACATSADEDGLVVIDTSESRASLLQGDGRSFGALQNFRANRSLTWSPDGQAVAATMSTGAYNQDHQVAVFDVENQRLLREPFASAGIRWKPDGHELADYLRSSRSGEIQIFDAVTNEEIGRLTGHSAQLVHFQFSPSGDYLATAGFDKTIRIWDFDTRQSKRIFQEHPRAVNALKWSRSGDRILSASWDKDTRNWQVDQSCVRRIVTNRKSAEIDSAEILDIDWHPNDQWLAAVGPKTAGVWDVDSGELLSSQTKSDGGKWFGGCEWSPQGKRLVFYGGGANIHNVDSDGVLNLNQRIGGWVHRLDWHPQGTHLLVAALKSVSVVESSRVSKISKWMELEALSTSSSRHAAIRWNPQQSDVFAIATGKRIAIFSQNGKTLVELSGHEEEVLDVDWHPNGQQLVSASSDGTARIWDATTGQELRTLLGHSNLVQQVSWAPDGSRVASAGRDGTVKLWHTATGIEILSLDDLGSAVTCVAWSHDGTRLAAGNLRGEIVIWDASRGYVKNEPTR